MSAHDHSAFVPGCFRCELSRDEVEPECPECHDKEQIQLHAGRLIVGWSVAVTHAFVTLGGSQGDRG